MALATTTLSAACALRDKVITVASATSVAVGRFLLVDGEVMRVDGSYVTGSTSVPVLRGRNGTAQIAHVSSANVTHGAASDFQAMAVGVDSSYPANYLTRSVISYSAAGAISFGGAFLNIAIINGTGALAMTLANPTKDQDGTILVVTGNGKAAHTVTYTAGLGNVGATADVLTFSATQAQGFVLVSANGFWNSVSVVAGAATVAGVGIG